MVITASNLSCIPYQPISQCTDVNTTALFVHLLLTVPTRIRTVSHDHCYTECEQINVYVVRCIIQLDELDNVTNVVQVTHLCLPTLWQLLFLCQM